MPTERFATIRLNRLAGLLLLVLFAALPARAGWPQRPGPRGGRQAGPMPDMHQPGFMERLRDLPPAEQERILANDARFRNLPPAMQQRIRENLRRWNSLTPEQRQVLREREQIFGSLSPEQQRWLRSVAPRWRQLPMDRRAALMQVVRRMRDMTPEDRKQLLKSPEIKTNFSHNEQGILKDLSKALPKPGKNTEEGGG